jgi:hypothetical protein
MHLHRNAKLGLAGAKLGLAGRFSLVRRSRMAARSEKRLDTMASRCGRPAIGSAAGRWGVPPAGETPLPTRPLEQATLQGADAARGGSERISKRAVRQAGTTPHGRPAPACVRRSSCPSGLSRLDCGG